MLASPKLVFNFFCLLYSALLSIIYMVPAAASSLCTNWKFSSLQHCECHVTQVMGSLNSLLLHFWEEFCSWLVF